MLIATSLAIFAGCASPTATTTIPARPEATKHNDVLRELTTLLDATHLSNSWSVDITPSPACLLGDYDGNGTPDCAVCLKSKRGSSSTIGVILNGRTAYLVSSEKEIGSNYPGPDWEIHPQKKAVRPRRDLNDGVGAPRLRGDAIVLSRPESSSALLYWDAGHLRLYWLAD